MTDSVACASLDTVPPTDRKAGLLPPLLPTSSRTSSQISSVSCTLPVRSPEDTSLPFSRICPASVIIQVGYFKKTGGKRIFRMTPIHHHFELGGWKETKIVQVFAGSSLLLGLIGIGLWCLGNGGGC